MELTLDQALLKGIEAHKAGKATEADQYYTAILKIQPNHPDANHNMGVLAVSVGKTEAALPFFKLALQVNPKIEQYWLSYIDALIQAEKLDDAEAVCEQARNIGFHGGKFNELEKKLSVVSKLYHKARSASEYNGTQMQSLVTLYNQGKLSDVFKEAQKLIKQYPNNFFLWNLMGAAGAQTDQQDQAILAFQKAININPNYFEAYNNLGNTLKSQGRMAEAINAYKKAIDINSNFAEAYYNVGVVFNRLGQLKDATQAYNKALSIKPDYAEAHNNVGSVLQKQGKLEQAEASYIKALSIKPDYAEAHNNLGYVLQDQGKLEEAKASYTKALAIKPNFAEAHRHLSALKKYSPNDPHYIQVKNLLSDKKISDNARCHLSFAIAKMYDDMDQTKKSFQHLSKGNSFRKKLLSYSIAKDRNLFGKLKKTQPLLYGNSITPLNHSIRIVPIFILGMPRSGTTLVEQIISSHPNVSGAGELNYLKKYGIELAEGTKLIKTTTAFEFRNKYLSDLAKLSNGKKYVTDKMPHNFRFIPLICATLPEAKIIHVRRDARAVCWSNYKHYFSTNGLGYCYNICDLVEYYKLYSDMMTTWQSNYSDRLYNLDYETLTTDQEAETKNLFKYLAIEWDEACLSPEKNTRNVRTASQQQVTKKVYRDSSDAWRRYRPYLTGAFESLPAL